MPNITSSWRFRHRSICRTCLMVLAPFIGFAAATLWHGATAKQEGPRVAVSVSVPITTPATQQAPESILSPKELAGMQYAIMLTQKGTEIAAGMAAVAVKVVQHNNDRVEELTREVAALKAEAEKVQAATKARRKISAAKKTAAAGSTTSPPERAPPATRVVKTIPVATN